MGWVYEAACYGQMSGKTIANIFHVWDGAEVKDSDDVADVFETNHLVDIAVEQSDELTWSRIAVTPLDVGNLNNPINRLVSIQGASATDWMPMGVHAWVKFQSDDNGFKSGGKMVPGLVDTHIVGGVITVADLADLQTIFDALLTDLAAAGFTLAIYRPTLSTPGFPSISTVSQVFVRGVGTNNRRQLPFQQ